MPEYIDLKRKGIEDACQSLGSPKILAAALAQIHSGDLLDVSHENVAIDNSVVINTISNEIERLNEKKSSLVNQFENNRVSVDRIRTAYQNYRNGILDSIPGGGFDSLKFYILLFVFLGLTIFLFYYYTGVPYESLIKPCDGNTKMFPTYPQLYAGIAQNPPLIFIAMVFFAFGIGLHFAHAFKNIYGRIGAILLLIIITFALDFSMAVKIHSCIAEQYYLNTGDDMGAWYESGTVYLLILLGFVSFFLWSFLFHNLLIEYKKKNVESSLRDQIGNLETINSDLDREIADIDAKIDITNRRLSLFIAGNVGAAAITGSQAIYREWFMRFFNSVNGIKDYENKRRECESVQK